MRLLPHRGKVSAALATAFGHALLLRIQPECFELPTPFRWSIAQPRDLDASRQAALYGSADQLGSKKGERDGQPRTNFWMLN